MTRSIPFFTCLALAACATHDAPSHATSTPDPPPAQALPPIAHAWPGDDRSDLVVPAELWDDAMAQLGRAGGTLGFTADEMSWYRNDRHALRTVTSLFRDVRSIPRWSGLQAKTLVADAKDPAKLVERAFAWTDVRAGRMLAVPKPEEWGVDWIPKGTSPRDAIDLVAARELPPTDERMRLDDAQRVAWNALPEAVQRLVVRIYVAIDEARFWIESAYVSPRFDGALRSPSSPRAGPFVYRRAVAPLNDEWRGQAATFGADYGDIAEVDREYLAFGSVVLTAFVGAAIDEWRGAAPKPSPMEPLAIDTGLGAIRIFGPGADEIGDAGEHVLFTVDLGGADHYTGRQGVSCSRRVPVGLAIDLGGNDVYEGGDAPATLACGLFGVGAIFDVEGNDRYRAKESALGCGLFGTGLLVDSAGDDEYVIETRWGQAFAYVGVGLLADLAGNDRYTCGYESQSNARTLGATLLLDVEGDDRYLARDDGNVSELYLGQSVAMSQGCGLGRRADIGDGHSMAGGIAFLVDGAGDDSYHATAWSQGCGYWWAAGFLEDLGGNDTYRNGKYSSGAAAHFAIGCQVDLSGDDAYNVGNDAVKNQFQGHARDGSIGVSIDGDGSDRYKLATLCGGAADLTSIGFLWDRRGDDAYELAFAAPEKADGWADTPPLGTCSLYPRSNDFRDDVDACGLFLDTGGNDRYEGPDLVRGDGRAWPSRRGPTSRGYGADLDWYRPR